MVTQKFDTLMEALQALGKEGFTEDFKARKDVVIAMYSKREYHPDQVRIAATFRFEGMSDLEYQTELFALEADDGIKGTLVMSYGAKSDQNSETIRKLKKKGEV